MTETFARLEIGAKGAGVEALHRLLTDLGYEVEAEATERMFGPRTVDLIERFQARRGLTVTGICDRQTWTALQESRYRLGDRLLYLARPMIRGDDVEQLQQSLNAFGINAGREDGIFGEITQAALMEFQRYTGLTADGIFGPDSLVELRRLGRPGDDSVARVRELAEIISAPSVLGDHHLYLLIEPGVEVLERSLVRELTTLGAHVTRDVSDAESTVIAQRANRSGCSIVVALRAPDDDRSENRDAEGVRGRTEYFATSTFRSERGFRLASRVTRQIQTVIPGWNGDVVGMRDTLLRETRMPAITCQPFSGFEPAAMRLLVQHAHEIGLAVARGIRLAVEDPLG